MDYKCLVPFINTESEPSSRLIVRATKYVEMGADELFVFRYSQNPVEQDEFLSILKSLVRTVDVPVIAGIYFTNVEDAKKAFNTGVEKIAIQNKLLDDYDEFEKAVAIYGEDKIMLEMDEKEFVDSDYEAGSYIIKHISLCDKFIEKAESKNCTILLRDSLRKNEMAALLSVPNVYALSTNAWSDVDLMFIKKELSKAGLNMNTFVTELKFSDFKTDANGLVPVIAQDYQNGQVLMLAYINEEAYNHTLATGRMTYYSRSRQELWCKGDTSGHFQYVKQLYIDCDNDTILAKVHQIGAACHTGNRTCFYRKLKKNND